ncbi:BMC domain-containing protein [Enterococcus raffinosus]|uniref:BMC domain-containing protein n=1 Tax=Enterococcus raffinosus TaxID=71452 RepID=UPI001C115E6E|nr:BMC domain-containing protein [Enterococcus raffinosus]MBU5359701.1 BMC domain-containing protein [Enterococcus raffinosus]
MKQAIGLVEVKGLASAIEVSDTMVKVANVELLGVEKAKGFGWMTVKVAGDVGAVKAAVDAGKAKAVQNNVYLSSLVIPRPANNLEDFFFKKEEEKVDVPAETIEQPEAVIEAVPEPDKVEEKPEPMEKPELVEPIKEEPIKEAPVKEEPAKKDLPDEKPVKKEPIKDQPKKKKNPPKGSKKASEPKKKK